LLSFLISRKVHHHPFYCLPLHTTRRYREARFNRHLCPLHHTTHVGQRDEDLNIPAVWTYRMIAVLSFESGPSATAKDAPRVVMRPSSTAAGVLSSLRSHRLGGDGSTVFPSQAYKTKIGNWHPSLGLSNDVVRDLTATLSLHPTTCLKTIQE
jgi:hypothetical protein